jgi:hypothetical protein
MIRSIRACRTRAGSDRKKGVDGAQGRELYVRNLLGEKRLEDVLEQRALSACRVAHLEGANDQPVE